MTVDPSQFLVSAEAQGLAISDPAAQLQLQQALEGAAALLSGLPAREDYGGLLQRVFGNAGTAADQFSANLQALTELLQASGLQITVELRSDAEMSGALGAYAAVSPVGGERIYLNADWITGGASAEGILAALLEEAGHAIDQRLNPGADAAGDEGELFAALLLGRELSEEQLALIQAQNDSVQLQIDGQLVQAEAAVSSASITAITTDSGTAGDFITNDQTLSFSISYTAGGNPNPLFLWRQSGTTFTRLGSVSVTQNTSGTATYDYTGTTLPSGTYTFWLTNSGNSVTDWAEVTDAQKLSSKAVIIDAVAPTVVITDDVSGTANGQVTFTFTFSEAVTGFTASAITVANGSKGTFTAVSSTVYTLVVTPTASSSGNITVDVAAGAASDAAGNTNAAPSQYSKPFDTAAPTVVITDDAAGVAEGPVTFTFTFSEAVTGFTATDITVANGSKGTFTAVSTSVYTLVVTPTPSTTGTITVDVAAGAATDTAGNASVAPSQYSQSFDTTAITVAISDDTAGTASGPVTFTFTFSEAVTGFTASDITVGNGSKGTFTAVSSTVYTLVVTPTASSTGNITIDVPADAATNGSYGNRAPAQYLQAFDTSSPTVVITDNAAGIASGPVTFTFTFSEAVSGFTADDITVGNGSKGTFSTVNASTYTLVVTPDGGSTNGSITLDVAAAAATDAAGNGNLAPAQYSQSFDTRAIRVTPGSYNLSSGVMSYELTTNGTGSDLLVAVYADSNGTSNLIGWQVVNRTTAFTASHVYQGSFNFAALGLTRLEASTISIRAWQGSAGSNYGTGSDASPAITYGNASTLTGNGTTGFQIDSSSAPNGSTSDLAVTGTPALNSQLVSAITGVTVDTAAPTLVISDDIAGVTNGPVTFTFTFSEAVSGFSASDVTVGNGSKGTFTAVNATTYTLEVIPTSGFSGDLTIDVAAGAATDAAGNASLAPSQYSQLIDSTAPSAPVISSAAATGAISASITGTAEAGSTVTISVGGAVYTTTAALVTGAWSLNTATATPTSGALTLVGNDPVSVTATDAAGNISSAASQALAPEQLGAPDLVDDSDTGASQTDNLTSDTTPSFSGQGATPGATVYLYNITSGNLEASGAADASGNWSLAVGADLQDGSYDFAVRQQTDASGNQSPLSASLTVTIDATAPTSPANSLTLQNDSGTANDGITRNVPQFKVGDLLTSTQVSQVSEVALFGSLASTSTYGIGDIIQIGYFDDRGSFVVAGASRPLTQSDFKPNNPGELVPGNADNGLGQSLLISLAQDLTPGIYQFYVRVLDPAGNASDASPQSVQVTLLDPADQPYVDVFTYPLDANQLAAGSQVAGLYFYNPEVLLSSDLSLDFLDPLDKSQGYFEIDASNNAVLLTSLGYQAYTNGGLSLPKVIRLGLVGPAAPANTTDSDTALLQYASVATVGSLYFIDFSDAWLGAPVDRNGNALRGSNPNQFNYFKTTGQLDASGSIYRFIVAENQDGAVGNNVLGTLYVVDASGNQVGASIQGVLSRVNKRNGKAEAVYFYEGTDYPFTLDKYDPSKKLVLLDLPGGNTFSDNEIYRTSSDLPRELFTELTLDIAPLDLNEASKYAVFAVDAVAGPLLELVLEDGNATGGDAASTDGSVDYLKVFQYSLDNGVTWIDYSGPFSVDLSGDASRLLVRVEVVNDDPFEGDHDFKLKADYLGVGLDALGAIGTATLHDDGTGDIIELDSSGNPKIDASGSPILNIETTKDDDRQLSVSGLLYNEGCEYINWTISGEAGLGIKYLSLQGDPSGGAFPDVDLSGNLEYFDGSEWILFDGSANALLDASGALQIRKAVDNDATYEGQEDFILSVGYTTGAERDASGTSSLIDDGTGIIEPSGAELDDDRELSVSGLLYNEGSPYIYWTVQGTAGLGIKYLSLEGDPSGGALPDVDLSGNLEYFDGSEWILFDGSANALLDASGALQIRKAVDNDATYEGQEDFILSVGYTTGAERDASGTSSLIDDGTGIIEPSGAELDDDRGLTVTAYGPFNEGSPGLNPIALFSIQANPGLELNLELGNTPSLLDKDATISGFTQFQYSIDGGIGWITYSWDGEEGDRPTVPQDGRVLVRVNISSECDEPFEGPETFTLTATYGSGDPRKAAGIAMIVDNGSGDILGKDSSGNPLLDGSGVPILDQESSKDDDRAELSIPDVTVNEASPYVVFQIYGTGGNLFKLSLSDQAIDYTGDNNDGAFRGEQGAYAGLDYLNQLEVYNGSTWVAYNDASGTFVPEGAALLLVRVPLINDDIYEAGHAFTLTATDTNDKSISGRAIISDFGTGPIFNDSGSENRSAEKDDDRILRVDSPVVNEASDHVVFHVQGITGPVQLALQFGNGTGFATLPNPDLE